MSDDPEKHLLIGEKERQYIVDALNVESAGSSAMVRYLCVCVCVCVNVFDLNDDSVSGSKTI